VFRIGKVISWKSQNDLLYLLIVILLMVSYIRGVTTQYHSIMSMSYSACSPYHIPLWISAENEMT